ncbi:MAG: hypothetical protein WBR26_05900 [Candidatus Acidiferrum sp.]
MANDTVKQLERLNRGEKLESSVIETLKRDGYVFATEVASRQTPGRKEFLFIRVTDKGRELLKSDSAVAEPKRNSI